MNIITFARFDDTGRYLMTVTAAESSLEHENPARVYVGEVDPAREFHNFQTGLPAQKGAQPSPFHGFDWTSKAWVADLAAIRTAKRSAIEAQREARIYAPVIVYDGANLDADATSQRNITEKLNDIARREQQSDPMPAQMLMWRDADNVDHTFADQAAYRSWLNGLAIALGLRGTQAYAWSWAKKAALEALGDDVEGLLAFDTAA